MYTGDRQHTARKVYQSLKGSGTQDIVCTDIRGTGFYGTWQKIQLGAKAGGNGLLLYHPQAAQRNGGAEMNFEMLLERAKTGDKEAREKIFRMYRPLLIKNAMDKNVFDEDLYQELSATLLNCIQKFRI